MTTEHLIEKAAKAIWFARHVGENVEWGEMAWAEHTAPDDWTSGALDALDAARAAWAVFEEAHILPTTNEKRWSGSSTRSSSRRWGTTTAEPTIRTRSPTQSSLLASVVPRYQSRAPDVRMRHGRPGPLGVRHGVLIAEMTSPTHGNRPPSLR